MPFFLYEAINPEGETIRSELAAASQEEVVAILSRKRLLPIKIEVKELGGRSFNPAKITFERFTSLDRIMLVRNLATTVKAGLSLLASLDILIADAGKEVVRRILTTARLNIQNGQSLSLTFEQYPQYFPHIFVGMIKAGEASGQLDKSLSELSDQLSKELNLAKKVKSALAYPVILLFASVGIVFLLLTFVLPRLVKTFAQSNVELPLLTRILVKLSEWLTYSFLLDVAVMAALIGGFVALRRTAAGRRGLSFLAFRLPVARELVKKVILVRFSRTLGSLISSALPIEQALELTARSLGNVRYEAALLAVITDIKNGVSLSESLHKDPELFPRFLVSLVAVGEKTGTLDEVLKTYADFSEDDVDSALKDLATFLEPLMLLLMGVIVGAIALSVLMPIYKLVGNFV